jgi:hypothetical protein
MVLAQLPQMRRPLLPTIVVVALAVTEVVEVGDVRTSGPLGSATCSDRPT